MQLTFILTCFAKCVFLVDFFVVTDQANYQDCSGIYTEVGIALAEDILELHCSFTLRTAFGHLYISRKLLSKYSVFI